MLRYRSAQHKKPGKKPNAFCPVLFHPDGRYAYSIERIIDTR